MRNVILGKENLMRETEFLLIAAQVDAIGTMEQNSKCVEIDIKWLII